jgi:hypothetical protein
MRTKAVVPPGKANWNSIPTHRVLSRGKSALRYRLEGYDKDWVETEDRRVAFYTNLKPGPSLPGHCCQRRWCLEQHGRLSGIQLLHFYQTAWSRSMEAVD